MSCTCLPTTQPRLSQSTRLVPCRSGEGALLRDIQVPASIRTRSLRSKFLENRRLPKLVLPQWSLDPRKHPASAPRRTANAMTETKAQLGRVALPGHPHSFILESKHPANLHLSKWTFCVVQFTLAPSSYYLKVSISWCSHDTVFFNTSQVILKNIKHHKT